MVMANLERPNQKAYLNANISMETDWHYGKNSTTGSGDVTTLTNEGMIRLDVTTASGDKVIRQTKQYFRYQIGKAQSVGFDVVFGAHQTGTRRRAGYFDADNGIFFEQSNGTFKIVLRSKASGAVVNTEYLQSNWNLDKLDGSGVSGITLDLEKINTFVLDIQWEGRIRIGCFISGRPVPTHVILHSNISNTSNIGNPNLPLRFEIENTTSVSSSASMKLAGSTVLSDGGFNLIGFTRSAGNGITSVSVSTRRPVFSIRPKLTFNSITNRSTIIPLHYELINTAQNIYWEIVLGGTISTPSWTSVSSDSLVEYDVSSTTISGGEVIDTGFLIAGQTAKESVAKQEDFLGRIPLSLNIAGDASTNLSIVATAFTSTATVSGAITWKELF